MHRKPMFSFDSVSSTGIDEVPVNSLIYIESVDISGLNFGMYFTLIDKTGITSSTTIQDVLDNQSLWLPMAHPSSGFVSGTTSQSPGLRIHNSTTDQTSSIAMESIDFGEGAQNSLAIRSTSFGGDISFHGGTGDVGGLWVRTGGAWESIYHSGNTDIALKTQSNSWTANQILTISTSDNSIDFNSRNNFSFTATAANITVTSQTAGQSGTIVIASAENITGWGTEFDWGSAGAPTGLTGTETFGYFISASSGVDSIKIGRL